MDPVSAVVGGTRVWLMVKPIRRVKAWRNRRRIKKGKVPLPPTGDLKGYNKIIGTVIAGLLGYLATKLPGAEWLSDPELAVMLATAVGTYLSPKNE